MNNTKCQRCPEKSNQIAAFNVFVVDISEPVKMCGNCTHESIVEGIVTGYVAIPIVEKTNQINLFEELNGR